MLGVGLEFDFTGELVVFELWDVFVWVVVVVVFGDEVVIFEDEVDSFGVDFVSSSSNPKDFGISLSPKKGVSVSPIRRTFLDKSMTHLINS